MHKSYHHLQNSLLAAGTSNNNSKFESNIDKDIWLSKDENNITTESCTNTTAVNNTTAIMGKDNLSECISSSSSIPMEFIQVLIHQHARTLVALQDLQREVTSLKSLKPAPLTLPSTSSHHIHPHHPTHSSTHQLSSSKQLQLPTSSLPLNSCCCWINSNKHQDSGFSTETKSNVVKLSSSSSEVESEDNELYSLLSLIQYKVQSLNYNNKKSSNGVKHELGVLDSSLGNNDFDFKKFKLIDKNIISRVLSCNDKVELRRQLLFLAARLKTIELQHQQHLPQANPPQQQQQQNSQTANSSLLRALEALKSENEQLRFKLQEMEIELEGTNAKLRILSRNKNLESLNNPLLNTVTQLSSTNNNTTHIIPQSSQKKPVLSSPNQQLSSPLVMNVTMMKKVESPEPLLNSKNKSLSSISSSKSLIPVPVARLKKTKSNSSAGGASKNVSKINNANSNFWAQWFG